MVPWRSSDLSAGAWCEHANAKRPRTRPGRYGESRKCGAMGVQNAREFGPACTDRVYCGLSMQTIELDEFDLRLLGALQADGRLTNQELADKVGLSASQCSRRRARLEERGIIRGYHADLSPEPLGLGVLVFVHVTLSTHSPDKSK